MKKNKKSKQKARKEKTIKLMCGMSVRRELADHNRHVEDYFKGIKTNIENVNLGIIESLGLLKSIKILKPSCNCAANVAPLRNLIMELQGEFMALGVGSQITPAAYTRIQELLKRADHIRGNPIPAGV